MNRILIFVSVLMATVVCLFSCKAQITESSAGFRYTPDEMVEWSGDQIVQNSAPGIKIPGFSKLLFPADSNEVQMTLGNPDANHCSFVYTLHLNEPDGEVLYTSAEIQPGMAIPVLTLNRALEVGEYTLYVHIAPYDSASGEALNAAQMKVPLSVVAE